jgi:hypothetical protein
MTSARMPGRPVGVLLRVLAGPAIWFAHFVAIYAAEALACSALGPAFLVTTAIAMTVIAGTALLAIMARAHTSAGRAPEDRFLPQVTLLLAALSLLGLLWVAWPAAVLTPCMSQETADPAASLTPP